MLGTTDEWKVEKTNKQTTQEIDSIRMAIDKIGVHFSEDANQRS